MLLTAWPGITRLSSADVEALARAIPATWSLDDLLGHISSESGFVTNIKAPNSTARGLVQMIEPVARHYHLDTSSFQSQIPAIVAFFKDAGGTHLSGADFKLAGFAPGSVRKPDDAVLYPAGSPGALANPAFQAPDGAITAGSVRQWWRVWTAKIRKKPSIDSSSLRRVSASKAGLGGLLLLAGGGLGLAVLWSRRARI